MREVKVSAVPRWGAGRGPQQMICARCGRSVRRFPSQVRPSGQVYCSRICHAMAQALGQGLQPLEKRSTRGLRAIVALGPSHPFYDAAVQILALRRIGRIRGRKATVKPSVRDLEWAAGFLEGEGSFIFSGRHAISAVQVNAQPVQRLRALFGGNLWLRRAKEMQHRDAYQWMVTGARARGLMMTVYSLMSQRRKDQIRAALEAA